MKSQIEWGMYSVHLREGRLDFCLFPFFVFPPSLSGLRKYANLVHVREGRLKMSREGRRAAREMLRPATDTYLVMITRRMTMVRTTMTTMNGNNGHGHENA